jgi:biopolymer transport protein ExbB
MIRAARQGIAPILLAWVLMPTSAPAAPTPPAPASLAELLEQVEQARAAAQAADAEREQRFLAEQASQQERLEALTSRLQAERERGEELRQAFETQEERLNELDADLGARTEQLGELLGLVRQQARETAALLEDSLVSAQLPGRAQALAALSEREHIPTIAELEGLWLALQREMTEAAKVVSWPAQVIGVDGAAREQRVTRVGPFVALGERGRLLARLPESGRLYEPRRQPDPLRWERWRERIKSWWPLGELQAAPMATAVLPVDPTGGRLVALLAQVPEPLERIGQGRLIGWIIIALGALGLMLALERWLVLGTVDRRMRRQQRTETPDPRNPLGRVLAVYRDNAGVDTETLGLMLDERIIKDTPALQRGLSALRILAMIAPLLGLLGTVTGLIATFQAITLFGTGDPKLMAGGISQALVTTVLGLIVAIPLILIHAGLHGRSRRLIETLEQQSAALVARQAERVGADVVAA